MNCPVCGTEVSMEQCDLYSGICHQCGSKAAGRNEKPSSPLLLWLRRIGHVILCAVVMAPFGVIGLVFLGALAMLPLLPLINPFVFLSPIWTWDPALPSLFDLGDSGLSPSERRNLNLALLLVLGVLVACQWLGGWTGVLIGGLVLGALIGATLSILSQWTAKSGPRKAQG